MERGFGTLAAERHPSYCFLDALGIGVEATKPIRAFLFACGLTVLLVPLAANQASAQTPPAIAKLNAYVGCINRLSAHAYDSRARYFSWAGKNGPTGRARIIYGTCQSDFWQAR